MTSARTSSPHSKPRLGVQGEVVDGRFRLEEFIGAGGFGEVWRAQEEIAGENVGVPCAVKLLSLAGIAVRGTDACNRVRGWVEEVRALRAVKCDAIPMIHAAAHVADRQLAYIAMELLEGATLSERIKRGPIPWRRALAIASGIANALDAAHALSPPLIHCDLKPQNVFLTTSGRVCVIDWGIASLEGGLPSAPSARLGGEAGEVERTGTMSMAGAQVELSPGQLPQSNRSAAGTPGYIAPEVYGGREPGPAADRYALGVVLHQMIAGRLPYPVPVLDKTPLDPRSGTKTSPVAPVVLGSGSTATPARVQAYRHSLLAATMQGDIEPLAEVVPNVPRGVAASVTRLLSLQPENRGSGNLADEIARAGRFPHGVPDPPYAGLEAFDETRAGLLFGRRAHVDAIVERLRHERALLLRGPSGCGKSSLAIAGVAARIDELMLEGIDGWKTVVVRPSRFVSSFGLQLDRKGWCADSPSLAVGDDRLGTVLVVDQLEEVLGLPEEAKKEFVVALASLGRRPGALRVVATVREDLEWQVMRIPELREIFDEHREYVVGIDAGAARELVEEPARASGVTVEHADTIATEVREELARQSTMLPMVEFALTEWWRRRDVGSGMLTLERWRAIGGVQGALSSAADQVHDALLPHEREALRLVFQRLFRGDRKAPLAERDVRDPTWTRVLGRLAEHRLVRAYQSEDGTRWYEATHEALARRWQRLQGWLSETAADDALIDELELAATLWRKQGRPVRVELPGHKLVRAMELAGRLDAETGAYVEAAARHARELVKEAQRRRRSKQFTAAVVAVVIAGAGIWEIVRGRQEEANLLAEKELTARALADKEGALDEVKTQSAVAVAASASARAAEHTAVTEREKFQAALTALQAKVDDAIKKGSFVELRKARQDVLGVADKGNPPPPPPHNQPKPVSASDVERPH